MRIRLLVIALVALTTLGACGDDATTPGFSATTRNRYMEGCTAEQSQAFCQCTLDELQERFTEDEFLRFAVDATEEPPDELIEVSLACIAEADLGG